MEGIPNVSKSVVTRLFVAGVGAVIAAVVLVVLLAWAALSSGTLTLGGPYLIQFSAASSAGLVVGLLLIAFLIGTGGSIVAILSWIGAILNTLHLENRTWVLLLLVLGVLGFGVIAMIVYVAAGPDSTRQPRTLVTAPDAR